MERTDIRLECLKLAHTHGRDIAEVVGRAKKYEEYVLAPDEKVEAKKPQKKTGNANSLD